MENMFLMFYQFLLLLGGARSRTLFPYTTLFRSKLPEGGSVCPLRSHIWGDFWPTQWTESMEKMVLMSYPVLQSLGENGDLRGEKMQGEVCPIRENRPKGPIFANPGVYFQWNSAK